MIGWEEGESRRSFKAEVKGFGFTGVVEWKLGDWSAEMGSGTPCVAVN